MQSDLLGLYGTSDLSCPVFRRIDSRFFRLFPRQSQKLKPLDLIGTAERLAAMGRKPRQCDLKRAVSTNYYALFHALCRNCADCFIGGSNADRSQKAWLQAYRAIDHGNAVDRCQHGEVIRKFPKDIEDFANLFVQAQKKRHSADYDPSSKFTRTEVMIDIASADVAIRSFAKAPLKDRRAFAAWVMIKNKR